jgi:hypothetical protein
MLSGPTHVLSSAAIHPFGFQGIAAISDAMVDSISVVETMLAALPRFEAMENDDFAVPLEGTIVVGISM